MIKVVLSPEIPPSNSEADLVNELFAVGLQHYHLRKYESTKAELINFLDLINPIYYSRIVLHQHFELLRHYPLQGIHLNSHIKSELPNYLKLLDSTQTISCSTHSIPELLAEDHHFHYFFLSPIFKSISKPNYESKFSSNELQSLLASTNKLIYGLGGIDLTTIEQAGALGFKGVVLLGGIWNTADPLAAFRQIQYK